MFHPLPPPIHTHPGRKQDVPIWQLPVRWAVPVLHLSGGLHQPLIYTLWSQLLYELHQQILGPGQGDDNKQTIHSAIHPSWPSSFLLPSPQVCQCPLCKKTFQKRPELQINRTLREITEQFRSMSGGERVGGLEKKRGGRGGGGDAVIPDDLFNELRNKFPRNVTTTKAVPIVDNPQSLGETTVSVKADFIITWPSNVHAASMMDGYKESNQRNKKQKVQQNKNRKYTKYILYICPQE